MLPNWFMALLGGTVRQWIVEEVERRIGSLILGMAATVATQAVLGTAPIRNFTSPNGDAISEAAVWMGVDQQLASNVIWCPVARGVTLTAAGGDHVHVTRDSVASGIWTVDRKL